jgi:drug/metabolite transporter (DMT)-like permease
MNKRNSGTLVAGAVLIAVGLLALFGQLFRGFQFWNYLWPVIIIAFGALFFVGMFAGGKSMAGLAIPGSIIGGIGLMMLFQNLFHNWESWSYGWTVILILVGLGIFIMGLYTQDASRRHSGLNLMKVGAILFVIFGGFFELVIFGFGRRGIQQYIFPVLLVLLGIYLVVTRSGLLASRRSNMAEQPVIPSQENTNSSENIASIAGESNSNTESK